MNVKRRAYNLLKEIRTGSDAQYDAILSRINSDPKTRDAMEYLEAKGLVKVSRALGGDIVFFHLNPGSSAYLQDQQDRSREKWLNRLFGYILGVITGLTVNLLTGYAQSAVSAVLQWLQSPQ